MFVSGNPDQPLRPRQSDPAILAYKRWLQGLRKHLGLTQAQMARQVAVREKTVAHWESLRDDRIGRKSMRKLLMRLANANRYHAAPI